MPSVGVCVLLPPPPPPPPHTHSPTPFPYNPELSSLKITAELVFWDQNNGV